MMAGRSCLTPAVQSNALVKSGFQMLGILEGEALFSDVEQISVTREQLDSLVLSPKGFAFLFWMRLSKVPKGQRAVLQLPKNQYAADLRVSLVDSNLCVTVMNHKGRVEQIFSEKKLKVSQWYLVTVDLAWAGRSCDVSLYINSYFQCEGSIPEFKMPLASAGELSFGAFGGIASPAGSIADIVLFSRPVREHQIREVWKEGQADLQRDGVLSSLDKIKRRDEMRFLQRTYAKQMKVPLPIVSKNRPDVESLRHGLESKGYSTVPHGAEEEPPEDDISVSIQQNIHEFFLQNPATLYQCRELMKHWRWVAMASAVVVTGQMDTTSKITLPRFGRVLKPLKLSLSSQEIKELAMILKANSVAKSAKQFAFYPWDFLKGLRTQIMRLCGVDQPEDSAFLSDSEEEVVEHLLKEEELLQQEQIQEQDDSLLNSEEEVAQVAQVLQRHSMDPEGLVKNIQLKPIQRSRCPSSPLVITAAPSVRDVDNYRKSEPVDALISGRSKAETQRVSTTNYSIYDDDLGDLLPTNWHLGRIEVSVNRCCDCAKHFDMCRHTEVEFVDNFNRLGEAIKSRFPNATIQGNSEKVPQIGGFDVYVRGAGPPNERDQLGRFMLFSKAAAKRFPTSQEITDALVVLALSYGDSLELEAVQKDFYSKNKAALARPFKPHGHPIAAPEEVRQQGGGSSKKVVAAAIALAELRDKSDLEMRCTHWGCGKIYTEATNAKAACIYHPGYYQFGSSKGLWPEGWSCCRGAWESKGCSSGFHTGIEKKRHLQLCVRHGEQNPASGYPDAFCGQAFHQDGDNQCLIHQGYLLPRKKWSCCQGDQYSEPCSVGEHRAVFWPQEEAKLYFFSRPVNKDQESKSGNQFALYGRFSGYFKKVQPYPKTEAPKRIPKEEQERQLKAMRVCQNWGCDKTFTEASNNKRACVHHPGRWDFGHSGMKISSNASDPILWKPHWTCCMKDWETPGCTRGPHRGPIDGVAKRFRWPDIRAQSLFKRKVSQNWQMRLAEEAENDLANFGARVKELKSQFGYGGKVRISYLPQLCDKLKLNLLVTSEDMAYYFKAQQVFRGEAAELVQDEDGNVDFDKFRAWWFAPLSEMLADPPIAEEAPHEETTSSTQEKQD